jgi:endonuclease-8
VEEVWFDFEHLKPYQGILRGRRIVRVETHGKAMLTWFDNQLSIYSHNQLYGRWVICRAHAYPPTNRRLRLAIHNSRNSALLYSASEIQVLTPAQIARHAYLSALGPDVLSGDAACILQQLQSGKHRRRRLGALLLDQRFLAGVGNYLRSEILFIARLHPGLRPADCSSAELETLAEAAVAVSGQSYRHHGVTNDLANAGALKSQGQPHGQYRHWVFGRADEPCRQCGAKVVRDVAAGRRIYFCPVCQPGPA